MSGSKHLDKIAWVVTIAILAMTILFMNGKALGIEVKAHTMGYENRLFDNSRVHTIDIVMKDWDGFISTATGEEYSVANLVIDGEAFKNVGIRGKGNTSLSSVSSMGSERYSFKVEFDQYDDSITYHGLDKLSLNNLIQDSTMMKDYLAFTLMKEFGAATPLCSFVYITVNGEDWGLYLAVEGVEDSFLERNYGSDYGMLYKPDSLSFGGGRGNSKDFNMDEFMKSEEEEGSESGTENSSENGSNSGSKQSNSSGKNGFDPSSMFGGDMSNFDFSQMGNFDPSQMGDFDPSKMGGFGMGSSDVKLQYIDDETSSYSNIWNNAKTDYTKADQNRLISALKTLSEYEDIESVVNVDEVLRYFVVHNFVCNGDSYTGTMVHNYYLYEEDGQLSMIPWDYNLAYGTFMGGNGQSTVNTPIDAPVSGSTGSDRPMWYWILSNEEYTELYHQYYEEFLNTVDIEGIIDNAYNLIKSYVAKDPTAFYSYEEFENGVETLRQFCSLRSQSISAQLENGETTETKNYADASGINLSDMGSMGGSKGGFGGRDSSRKENSGVSTMSSITFVTSEDSDSSMVANGFDPSQMPGGFDPSQMPDGFDSSQMPDGFDPSQMQGGFSGRPSSGKDSSQSGDSQSTDNSGSSDSSNRRPSGGNMQMPGGGNFSSMPGGFGGTSSDLTNWILVAVSAVILLIGLIIAKLYKNY